VKRSAALTALSRDHHHALQAALALRRADAGDLEAAIAQLQAFWELRGRRHFEIEERLLQDREHGRCGDGSRFGRAEGVRCHIKQGTTAPRGRRQCLPASIRRRCADAAVLARA